MFVTVSSRSERPSASEDLSSASSEKQLKWGPIMAKYLKKAIADSAIEAADAKVQETVAKIIADVKKRGDAAVRELSERLDRWSPPSFRLSQKEIDALVASVPRETIDDIQFAQAQIRKFAEYQKGRAEGYRSRNASRRAPRAPQYSGRQRGLLRARRPLSHGRFRAHEHRHRESRGRGARDRLHAAHRRQSVSRNDRGHGAWRRGRNLSARRSASRCGHGARHGNDRSGGHAGRPRQRLRRRSQAPAIRAGRNRLACRPHRSSGHRR